MPSVLFFQLRQGNLKIHYHGAITLSLLPPSTPSLETLSYQYPLKLVAPAPLTSEDGSLVHTVFILSYGGGLVAGDTINLTVNMARKSKLVLLTQGSTKIFKTMDPGVVSGQSMNVKLDGGSALCYLPDPVQPFEGSAFEQRQVYDLLEGPGGEAVEQASLCVCDWVSEGRTARGERWRVWRYGSRNEVWQVGQEGKRRLLLRDNVVFDDRNKAEILPDFHERVDGLGVFGTLIVKGPVFERLGKFFLEEFAKLPRIGARTWGDEEREEENEVELWRKSRQRDETRDGLLWTAANVRGFVLVKFGAKEVEGGKRWLNTMLKTESSVERNFGAIALHCLK